MGIKGLESFVEKFPEAFYQVDIRKLAASAKKIRRDGKDIPPTIIVDLLACERSFYGNLDVLCGGQGHQYVENLGSFTSAFESADIRLIFVRDGVSLERKRPTRIARKYERVERTIHKVFDTLERKMLPRDIQWKIHGVPDDIAVDSSLFSQERLEVGNIGLHLMSSEILSDILHQEVVVTGKGKDADQVISEMACDENLNVFAIMSQDSDFLIYQYPKQVHYLSGKHFDFRSLYSDRKSLRTYEYSRVGLAHVLKLEFDHLPLFATLKGQDLITPEELTDFHNKLIGNWPKDRVNHHEAIKAVAKFIREEKLKPGLDIPMKSLEILAKKIFGDVKRCSDMKACLGDYFMCHTETRKAVELNNFEKDSDWLQLVALFPENQQTSNLMLGHPLGSTSLYEDYRKTDLPFHATSFVKFRQRAYGVMFFEKSGALSEPNKDEFILGISELCMTGFGSLENEVIQRIEMPPAIHPGLRSLVKGEDPEMVDIKWRIFSHIISPDLNPDLLGMVGEDFLYPVCQLRILQHDLDIPPLYGWEIKVVLLHHLRYQRMTDSEKKAVKLHCVPTPRSVQIATLMTNTEIPLAVSLVPGLFRRMKILPALNFNGFVFQNLYSESNGSVEKVSSHDELEAIQKFYDIATSNGKRIRENFDELVAFKSLSIGAKPCQVKQAIKVRSFLF